MTKGASLRDRATHEQSPQAVSAVPVGIPSAVKAHPSYSEGYFDGVEGYPMQGKQPPEYEIGYAAGVRAADIFITAGMERQDDGSFAISMIIDAQGIEARSDETPLGGSAEGESPVAESDAPNPRGSTQEREG